MLVFDSLPWWFFFSAPYFTAIAIENAINSRAVKRVENRKESKRVAGFMANFLQN
jgi:hypothetical protein